MKGFGVHASMWTMNWDREGAERTVKAAVQYGLDFVEIPLLDPPAVDAAHTRNLLEQHELGSVCSLGLPEHAWASQHPDAAIEFLDVALRKARDLGSDALSGVTFGGIGERSGAPPTETELSNVARVLEAAARRARVLNLEFGIEPVNRYENHLLNTGWQAVEMIERVGADNMFLHLDTYHMNIEEKGAANGILAARDYLRYIHLSESDRGTPGEGCCDWDEVFGALAAVGFNGGMAMESFINMPPEIAYALSVWRPVAESHDEVMDRGLPFLRNKARQYHLI